MTDFKMVLAEKLRDGKQVALYCYGIYASYILYYLEKKYHVLPTVIIDNDIRKKGTADFSVPVMPFAQAKEEYKELQYFICSDDYKYTIIGDLLENGVLPEDIINYVPVEKRRTCLYFYNRLLAALGKGEDGTQVIMHCNLDSFKPGSCGTKVAMSDGSYNDLPQVMKQVYEEFENQNLVSCRDCIMNREQYMVSREYQKHYKQVSFYQETCADCLSHCVYCCVGGNDQVTGKIQLNTLESYSLFLERLFSMQQVDDDFNCGFDMSERDYDKKIEVVCECMRKSGVEPMFYKVNSCLLTYSPNLERLLKDGKAYVIWSLDAGTEETYRRIKQVNAFQRSVENVKKYIKEDFFGGRFIVPKYLLVKGINDNEEEFSSFLTLVEQLGLKFVSLSYDFYETAEEKDLLFIKTCYEKIIEKGLQLTYINNSETVSRALSMRNILKQ